jgi:hypothetical protein
VRESKIETDHCKRVIEAGGDVFKFVSPGRNGVPDRLILYPIPKEHRNIVSKYIKFVEFKAPGKKPRPRQERELKHLQDLGFAAEVIDAI